MDNANVFNTFLQDAHKYDISIVSALNAENPDAKQEFLDNPQLEFPPFVYKNLDSAKSLNNIKNLDILSKQVNQSELNEDELKVITATIDNFRLKNVLILAIVNYNSNPNEETERNFHLVNKALYGTPDGTIFHTLLGEKIATIESYILSTEEEERFAELKELLGNIDDAKHSRFKPKQETVDKFSVMVRNFMRPVLCNIPNNRDDFPPREVAAIIEKIVKQLAPHNTEWKVVMSDKVRNLSVIQTEKQINVPEKITRGNFDRIGLEKILVHEIGSHFLRVSYDDKSILPEPLSNMPCGEDVEEGIAKVSEQGIIKHYEDAGVDRYLSVGIANILGKNFRETYEIQKRLLSLAARKNLDGIAFNSVQRVFRGTNRLPINKDLAYFVGTEAVWRYIENNIDNPNLLKYLYLSGKTNIKYLI